MAPVLLVHGTMCDRSRSQCTLDYPEEECYASTFLHLNTDQERTHTVYSITDPRLESVAVSVIARRPRKARCVPECVKCGSKGSVNVDRGILQDDVWKNQDVPIKHALKSTPVERVVSSVLVGLSHVPSSYTENLDRNTNRIRHPTLRLELKIVSTCPNEPSFEISSRDPFVIDISIRHGPGVYGLDTSVSEELHVSTALAIALLQRVVHEDAVEVRPSPTTQQVDFGHQVQQRV